MTANLTRRAVMAMALTAALATGACDVTSDASAGATSTTTPKALKVGWSTIYLAPSWMQQTLGMIQDDVDKLKSSGTVASYETFNANGDTSQQIAQIRAMIQQKYDVILVDA